MAKETFGHRIIEGTKNMCHIWAEEMRATVKDEGVMIFFLLVPFLYPLLYSWIYNNQVVREVPVAVVDMSHSAESREFLREYDASPDVRVAFFCDNAEEARELIGREKVYGFLYFPPDFATRLNRLQQTSVGVFCDMSMMLTYKAIYQTASNVSGKMNAGIRVRLSGNHTNREDEISAKPLDFDEVPIFNSTGGYADFLLPSVLMLILQQTLLLGIGLSAGTARENNRYNNLVPFGRRYNGLFRLVLGKSLCYLMIYSVIGAYITLCIPRFFGFNSLLHAKELLGLMVPYFLACIFFGMTLSGFVRHREDVMLLIVFTSVPLLFLSGASWPLSNIPVFWKTVACIAPSTFGIRGFVHINTMGASLADIAADYHALWIQTVVYFFAACAVYRHQIGKTQRCADERLHEIRSQKPRKRLLFFLKGK